MQTTKLTRKECHITLQDLEQGVPRSETKCALANALRRLLPPGWDVKIGNKNATYTRLSHGCIVQIPLDDDDREFLMRFDNDDDRKYVVERLKEGYDDYIIRAVVPDCPASIYFREESLAAYARADGEAPF